MALRDGTFQFGPQTGRLLVKTGRTGMGARAGHDLTLTVTDWHAVAVVDSADPSQSAVQAEIDAASFEVLTGTGGVKPLTDSDRSEITRNIREKVLKTSQYPAITFRSSRVSGTPEDLVVTGDLTIMGTERPASVRGTVTDDARLLASATVTQSEWGIKPYSAFFGALKLADEVQVEIDATLVPRE